VLAADSAEAPHDAAAAAAALAELHADEGPAALGAALEVLQQRGLTDLTHTLSLAVQDRCVCVCACVCLRKGGGSVVVVVVVGGGHHRQVCTGRRVSGD
jgi:hypothetical protein